MSSETDAEFVERIGKTPLEEIGVRDGARLFALARRGAALTPRPIEEAPKDREVIGVERPPFEDQNYFHMGQWNEEHQQFMADAGYDMDTGKKRWAFCGVSHYVDPMAFPLLDDE
jgi:hypothetical protein